MTYKWYLLDWRNPQRVVVGDLTNVHESSFPSDGDTNLEITPDPQFADLLRQDQTVLECEINVGGGHEGHYEDWVRSLINGTLNPDGTIGSKVTAQGIWVEDLGHGSKTELHPMDVVFGSVPASRLPGDWIGDVAAAHGLVVGQGLLAYRFAVASDDRAGEFQSAPPLAPYTRPVTFSLPFPLPPAEGLSVPRHDLRLDLSDNGTIEISDPVADGGGGTVLPVTVTCVAAYDDPAPGADDQNPGAVTGEIVAYWVPANVPLIEIRPSSLNFHAIFVGESDSLSTQVRNTGVLDLVISIAAAHAHSQFRWDAVSGATIPPGGSLEVFVDFGPQGIGSAQATMFVQSNAAGSPHAVTLTGQGKKSM
jgi:hypothetical protein